MFNLKPRVIVCLDVANGRVVKGVNFKQLVDMGDPVELAMDYQRQGADEIVFLDIKASVENRSTALDVVTKVAKHLSIPFTVGGGLNSLEDVSQFLMAGADKVALNSAAVISPSLINQISDNFGAQSLVVAVDINKEPDGLKVYIKGGKEKTSLSAFNWLREVEQRGAGEILLTAMHKDGTSSGFDNELMNRVTQNSTVQIVASGGASIPKHFVETFNAGSDAALAAGMFHRGEYTIQQVKSELINNQIEVREC
ncbi:imidazole glycerol phosphate synthase subunit HisF [Kangiella sp. TOML190]|uniref:imidazole glycerol phosphate synthase subunit HisF n=1 Tax=Kangiella sp. TOML190 TaxID=2931351 RepID=UPI002041D6FD|nr:imidazole glycerol phosphate synthase subunit HisF [Kangiella sp. TOML190]